MVAGAVGGALALPLALALTDDHLSRGPLALVVSTGAAALAVSALALQPILAAAGRIGRHRLLGTLATGLVLLHVGALFALSAEDTWFAVSPDGPIRARMAVIATVALLGVALLGATRRWLPLPLAIWRVLHAYLAGVAIVLGVGHAVLTDGALDGVGTPVLLTFGLVGVAALPVTHVARRRRHRTRTASRAIALAGD